MDNDNKVLVLKEVATGYSNNGKVSGIFRLEKISENSTVFLSVINFKAKTTGEFRFFLFTPKKQIFSYNLGLRPLSFSQSIDGEIDMSKGCAIGICYVEKNIPEVVCFCADKSCQITINEFRKNVADYYLNNVKEDEENAVLSHTAKSQTPVLCDNSEPITQFNEYDDEVVATENYYEEDDLNKKLLEVEKIENESSRNEDAIEHNFIEEDEKENDNDTTFYEDEKKDFIEQKFDTNNPYYQTVKNDLDNIFSSFPKEESLEKNLPQSSWVKVQYNEEKYYVVGKVISDGNLRYICYGVPSKYSKEPPIELKGFCSFIPLSVFDLQGDGYWMMFQDAITGECVHIGE